MDEYILFEGGPLHGQKRIVPKGLGFYSVRVHTGRGLKAYGYLSVKDMPVNTLTYVRKNGKMVLEDKTSTNG